MFFALFDNLGGMELVVVLLVALLVFGRNLPQVASDAARQLGSLKRGLNDAWRQSGVEKEIREIQNVIPRDFSVSGVARQAAKRFEERVAEIGDEAKQALEYPLPHEPIETSPPLADSAPRAVEPPRTEPPSAPSPDAPPTSSHPSSEPKQA